MKNLQQILANYQPPWLPAKGELAGVVVRIDPAGGDSLNEASRRLDNLALSTGALLFHYVQVAGGVPLLSRADDRPASGEIEGGDVAVAIRFAGAEHPGPHVAAIGVQGADEKLARCLADSLGLKVAEPIETTDLHGAGCGAVVTLPAPGPGENESLAPRQCAERLYRGLAAFALARPKRKPATPLRSPVPQFVDRSAEQEMDETTWRIWPEDDLPPEKANWYCAMFIRTVLSDRGFVYFVPRVWVDRGTVVIEGATNVACMRDTLASALGAVGVDRIESKMRVLPEEGRIEGARFGVCLAATALSYDEPSESSGMRTQLLHGERVWLIDREAGFWLVHAEDGYWGWVRENSIRVIPADQFDEHLAWPRDAGRPASATVQPGMLVDAALEFLHRPYVFGGVSPLGLDCSGLVRNVLAQCGVIAARDAAQQFTWGRLVATRWHRRGIRAGDLLYFINPCGRIYHVGVAVSPTHFIHAAVPEVKINSLDPADRLYCPARDKAFLAARRL